MYAAPLVKSVCVQVRLGVHDCPRQLNSVGHQSAGTLDEPQRKDGHNCAINEKERKVRLDNKVRAVIPAESE
jgi:hypothetical protein